MGKRKLKCDGIFFTGKASEDVTGSQYLIKFGDVKCLLECGLHQSSSNSYLDSYKVNSEKFMFKPSEINYVFVAHPHIDHCGLIPRLVKEGFCGRIIATPDTAAIMKPLLLNSCYIINDEARVLSKRYGRSYEPLYSEDDVYKALSLIDTYEAYNQEIQLDGLSFKWIENSHCVGAAQLLLILKTDSGKTRKVLYTSDIGSLNSKNHYVVNTKIPKDFVDVAIMESTYGDAAREHKKSRHKDIEHLRVAIKTVLDRGGSVVIPCFSFSRTQEILTNIYELFHDDVDFNYNVIVDSKLSCEISKLYSDILTGSNLKTWDSVYNWKNVRFISEKEDSRSNLESNEPRIIISASGFCTNGRIVAYLKKYIQQENSMIIFTGYTGDNPSYLSYRIKNYREHKYISINKEKVSNKSDCISLSSFSSHASRKDLIEFGSSLNTNKLVLVHGSSSAKLSLKNDLQDAISKNNKTYRVLCANKGMIVHL